MKKVILLKEVSWTVGTKCNDCGDLFHPKDLEGWRFEKEVRLCANCFEERVIEDEEN